MPTLRWMDTVSGMYLSRAPEARNMIPPARPPAHAGRQILSVGDTSSTAQVRGSAREGVYQGDDRGTMGARDTYPIHGMQTLPITGSCDQGHVRPSPFLVNNAEDGRGIRSPASLCPSA